MALSYTFPLSPFPLIHSSFHFPFMIFLAPVSEVSPPQSDPEFYSVTSRAAGAQAGRRMGKNNVVAIQRRWGSESRNKTTFLPLGVCSSKSRACRCRTASLSGGFGLIAKKCSYPHLLGSLIPPPLSLPLFSTLSPSFIRPQELEKVAPHQAFHQV